MPETPRPSDRDDFETIAPAEVSLSAAASAGPVEPPTDRTRTPWGMLAGLAALVLLAMVVFLLLPERVVERPPPTGTDAAAASGADPGSPDPGSPDPGNAGAQEVVPPFEQLRLERERAAAQAVLEELLALTDELESRAVERWGADEQAQARALAEAGDDLFLERAYPAAQARYREAKDALAALLERADTLVEEQLAVGMRALEAGDAQAAGEAFELATAIDPGNARAAEGLERAAVLDEVLALLRDADDVARDGAIAAARRLVGQALDLDGQNARALAMRADLDARLREQAFNRAMSDGYAALREERFDAARGEFDRAATLRPQAPEVAEALRIVEAQALAARIETLRREARALEEQERWAEAAQKHQAALELDGTLAFARQGLPRARQRVDLDAALEAALAHPERLNDDAEHAAASALLDRARSATPTGPRLQAQIERLAEMLRVASIAVPVQFRSDGETRVTLLRVSSLGTFEQRTLDLRPGAYVATGTRIGYRDVRIEFMVGPSGTENPVWVRCETRI
ncbi:MAG TPA: hypothetical protein VLA56_16030 [Pseudomonadales bacterium]|nr:hypothetical protein [Pseudomonadales bacterium]